MPRSTSARTCRSSVSASSRFVASVVTYSRFPYARNLIANVRPCFPRRSTIAPVLFRQQIALAKIG